MGQGYNFGMKSKSIRSAGRSLASVVGAIVATTVLVAGASPALAVAAPPSKAGSASSKGADQIAEAIRKKVKSMARDKGQATLMKGFGLNGSDPAAAYADDAKVLDCLRSKPPLPMVPPDKQAETLADLYFSARMEGKGVESVEARLDELMQYATGKKPLHELNVPESERNKKKTCPHGRCTESMAIEGRTIFGGKSYDQYACPAGHETLLRVN